MSNFELITFSRVSAGANASAKCAVPLIDKVGGEIKEMVNGGDRKLPYSVDGEKTAYYHFYHITLDDNKINEFTNKLTKASDILRCLLIKEDGSRKVNKDVEKYSNQELRDEIEQYREELKSAEQVDGRIKSVKWAKTWAQAIIERNEAELARRGETG
jgi:ribosomal protein S6